MKKTMIALTAALSIFALSACNNADKSEVLVKTSAGDITKEDLYASMKDQAGSEILRDMVYVKILSDKYKVTEKELDAKVEEVKAAYGAQFDSIIQQRGEDTVRAIIKSDLLKEKAAMDQIEVKEGEVIRASHILVADEAKAKEIKAKLDKGESFEDLAKENSTDGSAANGGDLGWFTKEGMVKEFSDAAFALKKGEISEPVKSQYGFHIIKVTDTVEDFDKLKKEKQDEIRADLVKAQPDAIQKALDKAVKDAKVDVKDKDFKDLFSTTDAK